MTPALRTIFRPDHLKSRHLCEFNENDLGRRGQWHQKELKRPDLFISINSTWMKMIAPSDRQIAGYSYTAS
jgi:hypothetical protein